MERIATLAILGDSAAYGIGDVDKEGNPRGWSYYLAKSFEDPLVYVNFSRPGAQSVEVLKTQLPKALDYKPDIAAAGNSGSIVAIIIGTIIGASMAAGVLYLGFRMITRKTGSQITSPRLE